MNVTFHVCHNSCYTAFQIICRIFYTAVTYFVYSNVIGPQVGAAAAVACAVWAIRGGKGVT
jgi:hypothetical protein